MARLFETLKQAALPRPEGKTEPQPVPVVLPMGRDLPPVELVADAVPEPHDSESVSFIEVGPKQFFEASPDVLASAPPKPTVALPGKPVAVQAPSAGPGVRFQGLSTTTVAVRHPSRFALELVAYHEPEGDLASEYREVLTALGDSLDAVPQVLLFCPGTSTASTSVTLLNLAVTAARANRRVAVIDAHLRDPGIAPRLGLRDAPGLRDVLSGATTLEDALQSTEQVNLTALTAGTPGPLAGVRILPETWRSLLRQFRGRFDLVLVDAPRWDAGPDAALLAGPCDGVCLVAPESEADSLGLQALRETVPAHGGRLVGVLLTR